MPNEFVIVCRQPSNYMKAKYLLSSFEDPHWDTVSGGVKTSMFNQPFIYGYVLCTEAVEGEVAHSGIHGHCPHRIKVCAIKKDNKDIYSKLLEMAGPRPESSRSKPKTGNTCKKDLILLLSEEKEMRGAFLIKKLIKLGHGENNIRFVLKKLRKEGLIREERDPNDKRYNYYKMVTSKNRSNFMYCCVNRKKVPNNNQKRLKSSCSPAN